MPARLAGPTTAWAWEPVDLALSPSSDFTLRDLGHVTSLSLRVLVCETRGCRVSSMAPGPQQVLWAPRSGEAPARLARLRLPATVQELPAACGILGRTSGQPQCPRAEAGPHCDPGSRTGRVGGGQPSGATPAQRRGCRSRYAGMVGYAKERSGHTPTHKEGSSAWRGCPLGVCGQVTAPRDLGLLASHSWAQDENSASCDGRGGRSPRSVWLSGWAEGEPQGQTTWGKVLILPLWEGYLGLRASQRLREVLR